MTAIGTMRALDDTRGAVRMEDSYDTDIDDLWQACTTPERLRRWIAEVSGDLRVGGTVHAVFTSTWTGPIRVDTCDAPHHLLVTMEPDTEDETQLEAWLEWPMQILGFAWLGLLVIELTGGLTPLLAGLSTTIWIVFILDFALRLTLAPARGSYLKDNWITVISLILAFAATLYPSWRASRVNPAEALRYE